jgi:hypothetical protein
VTVNVEVVNIREREIDARRAEVARAVLGVEAAQLAIEDARAALEAAEALAIDLADQGDERFDEYALDLGTDQLVTALLAIGRLARV